MAAKKRERMGEQTAGSRVNWGPSSQIGAANLDRQFILLTHISLPQLRDSDQKIWRQNLLTRAVPMTRQVCLAHIHRTCDKTVSIELFFPVGFRKSSRGLRPRFVSLAEPYGGPRGQWNSRRRRTRGDLRLSGAEWRTGGRSLGGIRLSEAAKQKLNRLRVSLFVVQNNLQHVKQAIFGWFFCSGQIVQYSEHKH